MGLRGPGAVASSADWVDRQRKFSRMTAVALDVAPAVFQGDFSPAGTSQ